MGCAAAAAAVGSAFAGIGASIAAATGLSAATLGGISAGALIGGGLEGAAISGVLGGGLAAIEGKPILPAVGIGALTGGLTGGLGPAVGGLTGLGTTVGDAVVGAGTGALSSAIEHQDPLTGALQGGVTGLAMGALNSPAGEGALNGVPQVSGTPAGTSGTNFIGGASSNAANAATYGPTSTFNTGNVAGASPGTAVDAASQGSAGGGKGTVGGGGISSTSLGLGALSALGSLLNKPQAIPYSTPGPSSVAANLGPTFNAPLNGGYAPGQNPSYPGATSVNPNIPNYYRYGTMPEQTFFTGNSLQKYGFAKGGALNRAASKERRGSDSEWIGPGQEFSTAGGVRHVRGPGTGVSDSIDASLSDGEYVLTRREVSKIASGSNEAGARKLDRLRKTGALSAVLSRVPV